jgi:hypothetical protein
MQNISTWDFEISFKIHMWKMLPQSYTSTLGSASILYLYVFWEKRSPHEDTESSGLKISHVKFNEHRFIAVHAEIILIKLYIF